MDECAKTEIRSAYMVGMVILAVILVIGSVSNSIFMGEPAVELGYDIPESKSAEFYEVYERRKDIYNKEKSIGWSKQYAEEDAAMALGIKKGYIPAIEGVFFSNAYKSFCFVLVSILALIPLFELIMFWDTYSRDITDHRKKLLKLELEKKKSEIEQNKKLFDPNYDPRS